MYNVFFIFNFYTGNLAWPILFIIHHFPFPVSMMSSIEMSYRIVSILFPIYYYQTVFYICRYMEALRMDIMVDDGLSVRYTIIYSA